MDAELAIFNSSSAQLSYSWLRVGHRTSELHWKAKSSREARWRCLSHSKITQSGAAKGWEVPWAALLTDFFFFFGSLTSFRNPNRILQINFKPHLPPLSLFWVIWEQHKLPIIAVYHQSHKLLFHPFLEEISPTSFRQTPLRSYCDSVLVSSMYSKHNPYTLMSQGAFAMCAGFQKG